MRRIVYALVVAAVPTIAVAQEWSYTYGSGELQRIDLNERIEAASRSGGGRVVVPPGCWVSDPIVFKSNVELHLQPGSELVFTDELEKYLPAVRTSHEGVECYNYRPLIYAYGATNISLTGCGTLRPMMGRWETWRLNVASSKEAKRILNEEWGAKDVPIEQRDLTKLPGAKTRPQFIGLNACSGVRLEGFSLRDSPFWCIHLLHCENVKVRGLSVRAFLNNSDGIDVECSRDVLIEDCSFDQGDDVIVLKSGKDRDGRRRSTPTENVTIRRCRAGSGHGFLVVGSECSGGVRNVMMEDCTVDGSLDTLFKIKTSPKRGGFVRDITMRHVTAKTIISAVIDLNADYALNQSAAGSEDCLTEIRGIRVEDVRVERAGRCRFVRGDARRPIEGLDVRNVVVDRCERTDVIANVKVSGARRAEPLGYVDPLIGTEGKGGMMPCVGVPFGSFHLVPMTRINRVGQLSYAPSDDTLIGFILTRQPAIWMGDWGEVRVPFEPLKIKRAAYTPYCGEVEAGTARFEYTATAHAAWIRGTNLPWIRLTNGYNSNFDDRDIGRELPNFKGWRYVRTIKGQGLQIGVSLISLEQARINLEKEIGDRSFEDVVGMVKAEWMRYFDRVKIDASEDVKTIFYTGLYHTLLYPRRIDEYGRYYSAFDDKVHDGTMYSCFSLWDTYRAEHPWLTLVAPEQVGGMMRALLQSYKEGGWLPKWPNPGYTGIMAGAPAEIVLAEACAKGFKDFDWNLAYEAVKKNATVPQKLDRERQWYDRQEYGDIPETRGGLSYYQELGYVPGDKVTESVSRTQDFALADSAAAVLAELTGHADEAAMFRKRARSFLNLWNEGQSAFFPRSANGAWIDPESWLPIPGSWPRGHYTEQTWKTGVWAVPQDTETLARLLGGNEQATARLDDFFDTIFWKPERGNKSIHGNEPSHHCAYLYNRFGHPEKTQRRVHEILTKSYTADRNGLDGNEDCGQMSAWYILSALGFYPLDPVLAEYELGSPIVRSAELSFAAPYSEAKLRIVVRGHAPGRWRVRRVTLNGVELANRRIRHADLVKGGELVFEMDEKH